MVDSYLTAFIARLSEMDDDSLLRTLVQVTACPGEYQLEAIAAVRDEIARRRLMPTARDPSPPEANPAFRATDGQTIPDSDLRSVSGRVDWEIRQAKPIPAEAKALHERGRQAGANGRHDEALKLFAAASALSPDWPYPPYDAAFTCLLKGDDHQALEFYKQTLTLAPRGFFTAITAVHYLEQERTQKIPRGTYLAYLSLEWTSAGDEKVRRIEALTERVPSFAPAWKDLALIREDPEHKLTALDAGLAHEPDAETRGFLMLNKALLLDRTGHHDDAVEMLGTLATDPTQPLDVAALARSSLAKVGLAP